MFPSDLHYVLNKINKNYHPYLTEVRVNATYADKRLGDFYTPSLVKKVQCKFAKDFEFFGYELEIDAANKSFQRTANVADEFDCYAKNRITKQ